LLAAVATDDQEWLEIQYQLERDSKESLRAVLEECFRGLLASGLRSVEDVERALSRLSELTHELIQVPRSYASIRQWRGRPYPPLTEAQRRQADRVKAEVFPRLATARRGGDLAATRGVAAELHQMMPAMLPKMGRPEGDEDPELARSALAAYLEAYRSWFDLDQWQGARVSKDQAYWLIDSVACAPCRSTHLDVVRPMLQELAAALRDPEVRGAVLMSLEELDQTHDGKR
jgi:hypothetical protein